MLQLMEPMPELFTRSKTIILDFDQLNEQTPEAENIQSFFSASLKEGKNPRLPQNRQEFNDSMIASTGHRYLIGRYGEDRVAMLADTSAGKSGRTIHMAYDIFAKDLEPVSAPCDGQIVASDYEDGFGEYGNYVILQPPKADYYIFFGHLGADRIAEGYVKKGQLIAHLGDYKDNENGGWSRHLHLQILKKLPARGSTPQGYSTRTDFISNSLLYPDPLPYFPEWQFQ